MTLLGYSQLKIVKMKPLNNRRILPCERTQTLMLIEGAFCIYGNRNNQNAKECEQMIFKESKGEKLSYGKCYENFTKSL